eukprot:CAMPEP_0182460466 /NCGR_PEP_ID=MMETSP1319-20130603/5332_1 /TAXON_ID=172717 /ORGANISM="Bolidomonas pacifica, Strain RCC208" /LENGTH=37 /DNA_ID= /DNA_START= /DNA_END= /DNA_ORIENTATION=
MTSSDMLLSGMSALSLCVATCTPHVGQSHWPFTLKRL